MRSFVFLTIFSIIISLAFTRSIQNGNFPLIRHKRQFGFRGFGPQNYGQSSAQANANAYNNYFGPQGFGASNAIAGAQSFQSQGPLGGFGASAANSGSQGFNVGPNGINANAALSGSQSYNLPGGRKVNLAYGGSNGYNNGQVSNGNSYSLNYSR